MKQYIQQNRPDEHQLNYMRTYLFPIELIAEEDGRWTATCPALPGCVTWGDTREIAMRHAQEAVELYALTLLELRRKMPDDLVSLDGPAVAVTIFEQ